MGGGMQWWVDVSVLIDKISVFLAYNVGNSDNICDTGILSLFFRAMHYSAKCGLAIACRPCVRL